ncbi:MAG: type III pantothenate kinase [Chloroflexota bacterium]
MLFAVDIGNTNIVAGIFSGSELVEHWRVATDASRMPDEYTVLIRGLFGVAGFSMSDVSGAVVASVVPSAQSSILGALQKLWAFEPLTVSAAMDTGISILYDPPTAVGADRIANAVAAIKRYGVPSVVVDFGTATTFDVIDRDGSYIGGAIAPGLEVSMDALFSHTAQLPHVPLHHPPSSIGSTTVSSLQSGMLYGYAGLVDGLVTSICGDLGVRAQVIATGGLASKIVPYTHTVAHVDPELTLFGLYLLYERNRTHAYTSSTRKDQSVSGSSGEAR